MTGRLWPLTGLVKCGVTRLLRKSPENRPPDSIGLATLIVCLVNVDTVSHRIRGLPSKPLAPKSCQEDRPFGQPPSRPGSPVDPGGITNLVLAPPRSWRGWALPERETQGPRQVAGYGVPARGGRRDHRHTRVILAPCGFPAAGPAETCGTVNPLKRRTHWNCPADPA